MKNKLNFTISTSIYRLNFNNNYNGSTTICAGYYLWYKIKDKKINDIKDILKNDIDIRLIDFNTLLFFEPRQLYEIYNIIYGLIFELKIDKLKLIKIIQNLHSFITNKPPRYIELLDYISKIIFINNLELNDKLILIIKKILFLPYDKIDNLIEKGYEILKEKYGKDENK